MRHPRAAVVVHDLFMVALAWIISGNLVQRLSGVPFIDSGRLTTELLVVLGLQGLVLWATGLYKGLWRFASFQDMWNIARAAVFGTLLIIASFTISRVLSVTEWLPATAVYPVLLFLLLALPRMCYRFWKDSRLPSGDTENGLKRVLVMGAGRSGALLERELRHRGGFNVIGFLDDDERLRGAQVHGVPVLGKIDRLPWFAKDLQADLGIIAMPSATNQQMQRIVEICENSEIEFRTLPTLRDLGNQATRIDDLKRVVIDDLLGREPVSLNWDSIRDGLAGKRVMITGGGGSIGSELCRQIAHLNPVELVVVDNSEFSLYQIDHELRSNFQDLIFYSVLGDICDPATVEKVVGEYKPDMIFHAAAYKHLPILQTQVREAVRNNVLGTMRLSEVAERHGVGTFVLISTDKAVNPANIMGATKRVAEMYCQNMNARSDTRYITVRFGNVLNSTGSVVPLFKEQISRGGPVTVTHPEISRYFMTISEASQLIMQAAVLGSGGEIYVLDMGEPVKITYLAEQLIRLAGKEPGTEIQIIYTGLRPGEKLFEELFHELEPYEKTTHEKIYLAHPRQANWEDLRAELRDAELGVRRYDTKTLKRILFRLVPELAKASTARLCRFTGSDRHVHFSPDQESRISCCRPWDPLPAGNQIDPQGNAADRRSATDSICRGRGDCSGN
jgi:FlaA1/EpsC-like NDP-sugar epimerase